MSSSSNQMPLRTSLKWGWGSVLAALLLLPAGPVRAQVKVLNPLSARQTQDFYHKSEGAAFAPLWLYNNLQAYDAKSGTATGQLFRDYVGHYGYLFESASDEMPIGFSVIRPDYLAKIPMLGVTCSGCHVTELEHTTGSGTTRLRINGGPNMVDNRRFTNDFFYSLDRVLQDPGSLLELLLRGGRLSARTEEFLRSLPLVPVRRFALEARNPDGEAFLREVRNLLVREKQLGPSEFERYGQPILPVAFVKGMELASSVPRFERRFQYTGRIGLPDRDQQGSLAASGAVRLPGAALLEILREVRLLLAQLQFTRNFAEIKIKTPEGFGRLDAFGSARALLFPKESKGFELHAPAAISHLWGTGQIKWLHWNANTNSTLQRNIGQALSIGAQQASGGTTSALLPNLYDLESASQAIQAPKWPSDVFGPIDSALSAQGKALYEVRCAGCHESPTLDRNGLLEFPMFTLDEIGTDPNHAMEFSLPVGNQTFPRRLLKLLTDIEGWYYYRRDRRHPVSRSVQIQWSGGRSRLPVVWRDPLEGNPNAAVYPARSLKGIWATPPYLHNNSVPTLRDLLRPANQRPVVFQVGHREYDPVNIGFQQGVPVNSIPDYMRFDTTLDGNSNAGHEGPEFSTDLSDQEVDALLEYIKSL